MDKVDTETLNKVNLLAIRQMDQAAPSKNSTLEPFRTMRRTDRMGHFDVCILESHISQAHAVVRLDVHLHLTLVRDLAADPCWGEWDGQEVPSWHRGPW